MNGVIADCRVLVALRRPVAGEVPTRRVVSAPTLLLGDLPLRLVVATDAAGPFYVAVVA